MSSGSTEGVTVGIDTATAAVTVAVLAGGEVVYRFSETAEPGGFPPHARLLMSAVDEGVEAAGGRETVGRIAVGVGPGSFTGLRIGVATARALGQGLAIPVVGVSTLTALAAPLEGAVMPVIDARRRQVFAAFFEDGVETITPMVCSPSVLEGIAAGPGAGALAVGDGALRYRDMLEGFGFEVPPETDSRHMVDAGEICRLGAIASHDWPATPPEPVYLREPDAAVWLRQQAGGGSQ